MQERSIEMDNRKDLLLASAARLYSMGVDLEAARARLKELVEQALAMILTR